jgi:hypothetical protein
MKKLEVKPQFPKGDFEPIPPPASASCFFRGDKCASWANELRVVMIVIKRAESRFIDDASDNIWILPEENHWLKVLCKSTTFFTLWYHRTLFARQQIIGWWYDYHK